MPFQPSQPLKLSSTELHLPLRASQLISIPISDYRRRDGSWRAWELHTDESRNLNQISGEQIGALKMPDSRAIIVKCRKDRFSAW
jgi:hypothetical protein